MRVLLGVLLMIAGCGTSEAPGSGTSTAPAAPSPRPPDVPALTMGWMEPDRGGTALVVAPDRIALGDGAPLVRTTAGAIDAADVQGGAHGFLVPRIRDALATPGGSGGPPAGESLRLAIAPSVPYRTVTRVLYSAGNAGRVRYHLSVVDGAGTLRMLPLRLPEMTPEQISRLSGAEAAMADALAGGAVGTTPAGTAAPPRPESLELMLEIAAPGIRIRGSGGHLSPDCATVSTEPVATVPRTGASLDLARLAQCLTTIKRAFPTEDRAFVGADPETPFAEVAAVIAVTRGAPAAPLFPDVALTAGMR